MILGLAVSYQLSATSCQLKTGFCWKPEAGSWKRQLQFLYLQKIQLDGCGATENRDHHLERVPVEVDLVHGSVEARERTLVDPDLISLFERILRLRLLGRHGDLVEDLVDLL